MKFKWLRMSYLPIGGTGFLLEFKGSRRKKQYQTKAKAMKC